MSRQNNLTTIVTIVYVAEKESHGLPVSGLNVNLHTFMTLFQYLIEYFFHENRQPLIDDVKIVDLT